MYSSSSNLLIIINVPWMLGLSISLSLPLMLFPTTPSRGTTLHAPPPSSSKTAWYYRCLGLDPWKNSLPNSFHPQSCNLRGFVSSGSVTNLKWDQGHNMMKKSGFEKMVSQKNKNKGGYDDHQKPRNNRFLVNINIMGSAGPIRFVVNEKEIYSNPTFKAH